MKESLVKRFILNNIKYNEKTGLLTWKKKLPYRKLGGRATKIGDNRNLIKVPDVINMSAGRVIWILKFNQFSKHRIIHVNKNTFDDRLINLAETFRLKRLKRIEITQSLVESLMFYESETGYLRRKAEPQDVLGHMHHSGYVNISIKRNIFASHRIVWLLVHGYFSENEIDHLNGIRNDNRIDNLCEKTRLCNAQNKRVYKNSSSGYRGIVQDKKSNTWGVYGTKNSKKVYLGTHKSKLDAVIVRLCWEYANKDKKLCDSANVNVQIFKNEYGEFAEQVLNTF